MNMEFFNKLGVFYEKVLKLFEKQKEVIQKFEQEFQNMYTGNNIDTYVDIGRPRITIAIPVNPIKVNVFKERSYLIKEFEFQIIEDDEIIIDVIYDEYEIDEKSNEERLESTNVGEEIIRIEKGAFGKIKFLIFNTQLVEKIIDYLIEIMNKILLKQR